MRLKSTCQIVDTEAHRFPWGQPDKYTSHHLLCEQCECRTTLPLILKSWTGYVRWLTETCSGDTGPHTKLHISY